MQMVDSHETGVQHEEPESCRSYGGSWFRNTRRLNRTPDEKLHPLLVVHGVAPERIFCCNRGFGFRYCGKCKSRPLMVH